MVSLAWRALFIQKCSRKVTTPYLRNRNTQKRMHLCLCLPGQEPSNFPPPHLHGFLPTLLPGPSQMGTPTGVAKVGLNLRGCKTQASFLYYYPWCYFPRQQRENPLWPHPVESQPVPSLQLASFASCVRRLSLRYWVRSRCSVGFRGTAIPSDGSYQGCTLGVVPTWGCCK